MALMHWRKEDEVAVITWDNGENRHNPTFVGELLTCFDEIEADTSTSAVVITSSDQKNWSQGIDLQWIMGAFSDPNRHDEIRDFLHSLNKIFSRALLFPMPVIASINGHAFGDGSIYSCACDFRMMLGNRGFFCFPEVDVNIPFMPGMWAIVKKAVPYYQLEEMALKGKRVGGQEALENHIVSQIFDDPETLLKSAIEFGASFNKPRGIFGEMKRRMNKNIVEVIQKEDPPLIQELKLLA